MAGFAQRAAAWGQGKMIALVRLALIGALAALTCGQTARAGDASPDTLISLQRGACEQRCAVYRIVIFADGSVIYEGRYFVRRAGILRGGLSPEGLAKLLDDLDAGGFFAMEANYGYGGADHCDKIDGDGPSAILSVSSRGRSKTILHNHRCVGAQAERLTQLEDEVDGAVGSAKWIK